MQRHRGGTDIWLHFMGIHKYNYVCQKHNYSKKSRFGGVCPICRKELVNLGSKWRIGRSGKFDKKECKTKFAGQQRKISVGERGRKHEEYMAFLKANKLGPFYEKI